MRQKVLHPIIFHNYQQTAGSSTLELLIAITIVSITLSATIVLAFGNQSTAIHTETDQEALTIAKKEIETIHALSQKAFSSISSTGAIQEIRNATVYTKHTSVDETISPCLKIATTTITWSLESTRPQKIELGTIITDPATAIALGGDCVMTPDGGGGGGVTWKNPQTLGSTDFNPGKATSIDVLQKIIYLGADKNPYFWIVDARNATITQNPTSVSFTNGFNAQATVNHLDAAIINGTPYIFAVRASTSLPSLIIIDGSIINKPTIVASHTLPKAGYRITFFDKKLYVTTQNNTTGPELFIFDVHDPLNPTMIGSGIELGLTVNDIAIEQRIISGTPYMFGYFATPSDSTELLVYNLTDPLNPIELTTANRNLPNNTDATSVYILGNRLYVGRLAGAGSDLYVFDISNPLATSSGLPILGERDINTGIYDLVVNTMFIFLSTSKANEEFQVWNSHPSILTQINNAYNFPNIADAGLDFEDDRVYIASMAHDALRILYSPN